jgi:hypothetical protein
MNHPHLIGKKRRDGKSSSTAGMKDDDYEEYERTGMREVIQFLDSSDLISSSAPLFPFVKRVIQALKRKE